MQDWKKTSRKMTDSKQYTIQPISWHNAKEIKPSTAKETTQ